MESLDKDYHARQNAPSVISSRDIVSEDGDEYYPEGALAAITQPRQSEAPTSTSSRPASPPQAPYSRRGVMNRRGGHLFGGPGLSMSNTSRPQSAYSRNSLTHAPSITSQAFFRPMSSQRLQAQRGTRPGTAVPEELPRLSSSTINRPSIESHRTVTLHQEHGPPPSSRGTDFTEHDPRDRIFYNPSPSGNNTAPSAGESTRPLHTSEIRPSQFYHASQRDQPSTLKAPESFASSFFRTSKNPTDSLQIQLPRDERLSNETGSPHLQEKVRSSPRVLIGRNHEYFSGNTVFFWGGRLQNTRDRPINIVTGILVLLPTILFFVYEASYLWHNVSPALPIIFAYLFFVCISSFIHASMTDPGILPRNLHPLPAIENSDDPLTLGPAMTSWTMIKSFSKKSAAMEVPTKYCKTCNIWRPPRTHHCRICDSCIETQDHHCVWLNNCVGRRNYRYFFTFVSSGTSLGILLAFVSLGYCTNYSSTHNISFGDSIDQCRVQFALFIYGLLATPYPACLMGYHLFLMGRGETTREYLNSHNFLKRDRHRPFDQGNIFQNWHVVLTRPRPPSYLRFKEEHIQGDPRFGERRSGRQALLVVDQRQQDGELEMHNISGQPPSFQGPAARGKSNFTKY